MAENNLITWKHRVWSAPHTYVHIIFIDVEIHDLTTKKKKKTKKKKENNEMYKANYNFIRKSGYNDFTLDLWNEKSYMTKWKFYFRTKWHIIV